MIPPPDMRPPLRYRPDPAALAYERRRMRRLRRAVVWGTVGFFLGAVLVLLAACVPPPPKGGAASQRAVPDVRQDMRQPDAPEGASTQHWSERTTEHRPDGIIVVRERKAETVLGGSQDWAKIVREYARLDLLKGLLIGLGLLVAAIVAWSQGWPIAAGVLFIGAGAAVLWAWWAGLIAAAVGMLIRQAFLSGLLAKAA